MLASPEILTDFCLCHRDRVSLFISPVNGWAFRRTSSVTYACFRRDDRRPLKGDFSAPLTFRTVITDQCGYSNSASCAMCLCVLPRSTSLSDSDLDLVAPKKDSRPHGPHQMAEFICDQHVRPVAKLHRWSSVTVCIW